MPDKLKVMVVDDEKEFCQNVKDILEMKSYEVTTAYDGFTALEFIEQNDFDLVILDVRMPGINGVETFKKIKILIPGTPVIMVTAYTFEDLLKEALREGALTSSGNRWILTNYLYKLIRLFPKGPWYLWLMMTRIYAPI